MLDAIAGKLVAKDDDFAVVDVNGLQMRAEIPASTAGALPELNQPVRILTRLSFNANDGQFQLFGFGSEMERECFDIFTGISGIGPRKGLMILSQIDIPSFARAIIAQDLNYLSKIKGVGRKTAERLVLELREKMAPYSRTADTPASLPRAGNVQDAVEAMMALGCRQAVAEKAISEAVKELGESAPIEALIKAGLRFR